MTQRRPHELRVIGEKAELATRIFALESFFDSQLFEQVDFDEQIRMKDQCMYMNSYVAVLEQRIAAFPPIVGVLADITASTVNVTELSPDLAVFKEAVPIGAEAIADIDTFAMMIDHWHGVCMEHGNRLLTIPEGTTIEMEDVKKPGQTIEMDLNGAYLQVFRVGVMTALHQFKDLPFGASIEEAPTDGNHAAG